ncbi:MAG: dethiobiotin synthase [Pedosphaera sp.]|nr:dethiobiotin synthase [Pedosphaera sp.]
MLHSSPSTISEIWMKAPLYITGTDSNVGKTVLTVLLTRVLRDLALQPIPLKPVSTGDRADARQLALAAGCRTSLDGLNPYHFRSPLAPSLAARQEGRPLHRAAVSAFLRKRIQDSRGRPVLIEGAGGLLTPLGEDFSARELIADLRAIPIIVAVNKLGAINQVRLVVTALPQTAVRRAFVVLVSTASPDLASRTNIALLAEFFPADRIHPLPRLRSNSGPAHVSLSADFRARLLRLLAAAGIISDLGVRPVALPDGPRNRIPNT